MKELTDEQAASLLGGAGASQSISQSVSVSVVSAQSSGGPSEWSYLQNVNGQVTQGSGTGDLSLYQEQVSDGSQVISAIQIIGAQPGC